MRQFCLESNLSCWNFSTQPQDRLCIAQHDMALKEQGIRGLGCFLSKSRNLTILWSGRYFSRLWLIICWASLGCEWNWFVTVFWRLPFGKKGIRVTFPVQFMSKSCRGYEYICTSVSFFSNFGLGGACMNLHRIWKMRTFGLSREIFRFFQCTYVSGRKRWAWRDTTPQTSQRSRLFVGHQQTMLILRNMNIYIYMYTCCLSLHMCTQAIPIDSIWFDNLIDEKSLSLQIL